MTIRAELLESPLKREKGRIRVNSSPEGKIKDSLNSPCVSVTVSVVLLSEAQVESVGGERFINELDSSNNILVIGLCLQGNVSDDVLGT